MLIVLNITIFIGLLSVTVIAKVYLLSIFSNALNAIVSTLVRPNLLRKDLNNIRGTYLTFIPYHNVTSEVGLHFNLKNHDFKKDLKFCIFNKDLNILDDRLSIETDMINIFKLNGVPLLNVKVPNHNFINRLSFF